MRSLECVVSSILTYLLMVAAETLKRIVIPVSYTSRVLMGAQVWGWLVHGAMVRGFLGLWGF